MSARPDRAARRALPPPLPALRGRPRLRAALPARRARRPASSSSPAPPRPCCTGSPAGAAGSNGSRRTSTRSGPCSGSSARPTPKLVAGYVDARSRRSLLAGPRTSSRSRSRASASTSSPRTPTPCRSRRRPTGVRLLGPFDLFLQGRDRELVLPDEAARKDLWRTLGRPGAVLDGHELVGSLATAVVGQEAPDRGHDVVRLGAARRAGGASRTPGRVPRPGVRRVRRP